MKDQNCCRCGHPGGERKTKRDAQLKNTLAARLNRIEGQVRGIRGMIERDDYCDDVLNQIAAARAALDGVGRLVLENHLRGCLAERLRSGDDSIVDELIATVEKLMR